MCACAALVCRVLCSAGTASGPADVMSALHPSPPPPLCNPYFVSSAYYIESLSLPPSSFPSPIILTCPGLSGRRLGRSVTTFSIKPMSSMDASRQMPTEQYQKGIFQNCFVVLIGCRGGGGKGTEQAVSSTHRESEVGSRHEHKCCSCSG